MKKQKRNCWPTPKQELLLQAALIKGEKGVNAWKQWRREDLNHIDSGSLRLIPLLYHNLSAHGVQSHVMKRYRGIYNNFWARNQLLFHSIKPILAALHKADIAILLFKGIGLILTMNINAALRPMADIDLIVHPEDIHNVLYITEKLGWYPKFGSRNIVCDATNEVSLRNKNGQFIDIHLHSLLYARWGAHEMKYWERAVMKSFNDVPVNVMDVTDQLINVIVHGIAWNIIPPIRWIADAMMLLQNPRHRIQWSYLVEQTKKLHATRPLFEGLQYLKKEMAAPVPGNVLSELQSVPVPFMERITYRLLTEPLLPFRTNFMALQFFSYHAYRDRYPFPGFFRYLQARQGVQYWWQVPGRIINTFLRNFCYKKQ